MQRYPLVTTLLVSSMGAMAQLPPYSVAPDFTANDIDGNSHHLYEYLDQGYTVILDFSSAWCPPCWSYHNTNAPETLYEEHAPGTADDKVMVFFIEGEYTTAEAQMRGTTTSQTYAG